MLRGSEGRVVAAVEPWLMASLSPVTARLPSDLDDARRRHSSGLGGDGDEFVKDPEGAVSAAGAGESTGLELLGVAGSPLRGVRGVATSFNGGGGANASSSTSFV